MSEFSYLSESIDKTPVMPPQHTCPKDGTKGKPIKLITLKSLLIGAALERLDPQNTYMFCPSSDCSVVYFSETDQIFTTRDLKVSVFQKDPHEQVSVCYCFDWSRQRLQEEIQETGTTTAVTSITAHIKAKRCGCEVNNPQGACCLANVRETVQQIERSLHSHN